MLGFSNLTALDRNDLVNSVEKIAEAERLLSKENTEWNSEKETLLLELSLIKASIKDFSGNQKQLLSKITALKKKKEELETLVENQEKLLKNINNFASKNSTFLVSSCKKIPESMQFIIAASLKHLQTSMKDENTDVHERLNAINALTSAVLKAQKEVHRTKEVLRLDNSLQEVDALYLGTFTGYFRTTNGNKAGRIVFINGIWTGIEDSTLTETINSLFDQFDKKGAPKMINLPIGGKSK